MSTPKNIDIKECKPATAQQKRRRFQESKYRDSGRKLQHEM